MANRPGSVTRIDEDTFMVRSENHLGLYRVSLKGGEGECECEDYRMRRAACKHLHAAIFYVRGDKPPLKNFFDSRPKTELGDHQTRAVGMESDQSLTMAESQPRQVEQVNRQDDRIAKGVEIAQTQLITRTSDGSFHVPSQTILGKHYLVRFVKDKWVCSCLDFQNRAIDKCKHIVASTSLLIETYFKEGAAPEEKVVGNEIVCPRCGSANHANNGHVKKSGKRLFRCRDCGIFYREPSLWKRARRDPEFVVAVLDMYCLKPSLREISQFMFRAYGVKASHQTLWKWMVRWTLILDNFCSALKPTLSEVWHVDEMEVKMKGGIPSTHGSGQWMWQWNVIDKGTKFLIASVLTTKKTEVEVMHVLRKALEEAKNTPVAVVHDKLASYPRGIERAFILDSKPPLDIAVLGGANGGRGHGNQQAERINNTMRERDKVRRGLKTPRTPLVTLQRIHYNFIRPHMSLGGKTPAEAAGLESAAPGRNKLLALLENALIFRHHAASLAPAPPMK